METIGKATSKPPYCPADCMCPDCQIERQGQQNRRQPVALQAATALVKTLEKLRPNR